MTVRNSYLFGCSVAALMFAGCTTAGHRGPPEPPKYPTVQPVSAAPRLRTLSLRPMTAEQAGIDRAALDRLLARSRETRSSSLVVMVDGAVVIEEYFGHDPEPVEAMSATKSIVALALGKMIDDGVIASLDTPVWKFYPQWKQGRKKEITLRHLMQHTSGLQNAPSTAVEIYPSPNFVELALAAELSDSPGAKYAYNNKAVNLLAGIVQVASGQRMDLYIRDKIFVPLGITNFSWSLDKAGNPHAMSGLKIHALDLAKIGQMMLERGKYGGNRVLSEAFVKEAWTMDLGSGRGGIGMACGLLWWGTPAWERWHVSEAMVEEWIAAGLDPDSVARLRPLVGISLTKQADLFAAMSRLQIAEAELSRILTELASRGLRLLKFVDAGPMVAYSAVGYLGQYLTVIPEARLVAVRQIREDQVSGDEMNDFISLVLALKVQS